MYFACVAEYSGCLPEPESLVIGDDAAVVFVDFLDRG